MSTPFNITIGGRQYKALPPSFAFQKAHREQVRKLEAGEMKESDFQDYMAEVIVHCVQRAAPDVPASEIEERLDIVDITRISAEIGLQTRTQIAAAMGVDSLGEAKAGAV